MKKRYVIVRVDEGCPLCDINIGNINACKISKSCQNCRYGDTKEQLIRKVAQVLFIRKMKAYKKILGITPKDKKDLKQVYEKCLETAKEIVEFLGVE